MSEISRAVLFGKLDTLLFTSLESATAFCKLRGNPYVELVHWLHQLMQQQDGDLQQVIRTVRSSITLGIISCTMRLTTPSQAIMAP